MNNEILRVVVLNYNRAAMTIDCVASILNQDHPHIDIVVVDNHSAASEVALLKDKLPTQVKLIQSSINSGYAAGNNLGVRYQGDAQPEYVLISNNDVIYDDISTFKTLVNALKRDKDLVACSPLVFDPRVSSDAETQIQVRRVPSFKVLLIEHSWWLRRLLSFGNTANWYMYVDERPYSGPDDLPSESVNGSCFLIRADFLKSIGEFDEGTFLYQEELILGAQIIEKGKKACLVTSTTITHNQGATSSHNADNFSLPMWRRMLHSEIYYCRKYLKSSPLEIGLLLGVRSLDLIGKISRQAVKNRRWR